MTFLPNLKIETYKHVMRALITVALAFLIQATYGFSHQYWLVLTAFIISQTAENFPLKQGINVFVITIAAMLFANWLKEHAATITQLNIIALIYISLNVYLMLNRLTPWRQYLLLIYLLVVVLFASFSPLISSEFVLADCAIGTVIGVFCLYLVCPVKTSQAFRTGLVPILNATVNYIDIIVKTIQHKDRRQLANTKQSIENLLGGQTGNYPEWVYEVGFNPGLRAGFRYFLIYLDRVIETLFSIDYILTKNSELPDALANALQHTLQKNQSLLKILLVYFENNTLMETPTDLTSDISELEKSLKEVVPVGLELLDVAPQYVFYTALVRDIKDMRQLLLQLLISLSPEDK